ncbi:MAG TPA: hypothetical protein VFG83_04655 [Kofleriaceae bacterium]|nr:hypothetical protein [Kofleriaceae bacterium]
MRMSACGLFALALVGLGACGGTDDRPATWSYVHAAIIAPNCTTSACHSELSKTAGLNFETPESAYIFLTGRVCDGTTGVEPPPRNFVTPFRPAESKLMYLLLGTELETMPPDVPLPEADIDLIERWILEGAQCN